MIRRLGIMAAVLVLAVPGGCAPGRGSRSAAPASQGALDEATRLDQQCETLEREARVREAIPLAERSLALREQALGPLHRDVATSLNQLGMLYRARGAYAAAEPLLARALDVRDKLLGPSRPEVGQSASNLGLLFLDRAAYHEAEPLLVRALDIAEQAHGPHHPEVAQALGRLAELHCARGEYTKAEPFLLRARDIVEKALGPMHPGVARSLHQLGELYRVRGLYAQAEPLLRRALEVRENTLGPVHPDVAASLGSIASLLRDRGVFQEAEPLYVRALGIAEHALGPTHPDVARILNHFALLRRFQGIYDEAESLHARALDLAENAFGPMHPDVANYLSNLGALHWTRGAYGQAERLHTRALDIRERALGETHTDVAASLNNLALALQDQGAHGKAEPLYLRTLAILEKAFGPTHPRVASALNNLAVLYWELGAYDKAKPLLERAIDVATTTLGSSHASVAQSLSNLAILHHVQGAYAEAEPLYVRALHIAEQALGRMHPDVATPLTSLAWLHRDQGQFGKAEPLLLRALDIRENAFGPQNPGCAWSLNSLGSLYRDEGQHAKAAPLLLRALEIREKALGPMHPELATSLNNLARLYWAQGAHDRAEPLLRRAAEIREAQLRVELPRLAEPRKRAFITHLQVETDSLVSLHAHAAPRSRRALELALTTVLRRKGRILDSLVASKTALRPHLTPQLRDQLDELDRVHAELVAKLYTPREATDQREVAALRARVDELEAALSAASAGFRARSQPVTLAGIQAALPPGAALVELVRYHHFEPRQSQRSPRPRYTAYVVAQHGPPRWVSLGAAPPIDAKVDAVLAALDSAVGAGAARAALQRLDAAVLAPLRAHLKDVSHVIFAPDGKLNLVPFEALVDPRGRYALQRHVISYVSTGRDLLRLAVPGSTARPRSAAAIFAAPDYGPAPSTRSVASFPPLTAALGEATDLQRYFPTPPWTGDKATKSALKALAGPAMLHIATHGFYARDRGARPMAAPGNPSRDLFADGTSSLLPPRRADDPADGLDRAGLAMAGANRGPAGIVTARELAGFDWWGTQLVVLSACETGIGAVPSGDGVHGMRRALVLAGTASQVVSLWNVDDESTRELMRGFYAELARGTGRAEALRRAKLRMMRQPRFAHPHHWAPFIPAGDWRPLGEDTIVKHGSPWVP